MPDNDRIILDTVLDQTKAERVPESSDSDYFLIFAAEQITKDLDLSFDELETGFVEGGGDGGIDAMYVLVNNVLLQEDTELWEIKGDVIIDVILLQCSSSDGFKLASVQKLTSASRDLLDLSTKLLDFTETYNSQIRTISEQFRTAIRRYASKFPDLRVHYYYATKGSTSEIHGSVTEESEKLKCAVSSLHSAAAVGFEFLGARELITLARQVPPESMTIQIVGTPITTDDSSYICLVTLRDYYKFITQQASGRLRRHMFESNVRDYQGDVRVNRAIRDSLSCSSGVDFWWLNNGVTILTERIVGSGRSLTLANPLVVNGLQTSFEVYSYFASGSSDEERMLLVRIIQTDDDKVRDNIIEATNTQTPIPAAWLKSTGELHRDIEDFLKQHGLYYDRRKNYHKNLGRPRKSIISIPHLAQAVMAIALREPDNARGRPSTLLKRESDYSRVFSPSYSFPLYLFCILLIRKVEEGLRNLELGLVARDINNLKFHVALLVANRMTGKRNPSTEELSSLANRQFDDTLIAECARHVLEVFRVLGGTDQVAKGPEFARRIKKLD